MTNKKEIERLIAEVRAAEYRAAAATSAETRAAEYRAAAAAALDRARAAAITAAARVTSAEKALLDYIKGGE